MRNLKKLFVVFVSLTILFTKAIPAMATVSVNTDEERCEYPGALIGSGNGVDEGYLATATTRAQGATIPLRLMGKMKPKHTPVHAL